jgi:hypothetical protein
VLEFKRVLERSGGVQEKVRQRAEQQHGNLVRGLSKAIEESEWRVTLIVFVGGMCGSVEEKAFNANMELMGVIESERTRLRDIRLRGGGGGSATPRYRPPICCAPARGLPTSLS